MTYVSVALGNYFVGKALKIWSYSVERKLYRLATSKQASINLHELHGKRYD